MGRSNTYIAYLRVSTARQGRSGLGLEAQRTSVQQFVASRSGELIAPDFVEVESGKGHLRRPELLKALNRCKVTGATLVVAKLDRLSRNAAFLMTLRDSGTPFVAADIPDANTMTIGVMATVAQHEREAISSRTKAALEAAKAKGRKLGGKRDNSPDIRIYQEAGCRANKAKAMVEAELRREAVERAVAAEPTLNSIALHLNDQRVRTSRGSKWTAMAVSRIIDRLALREEFTERRGRAPTKI